ncbi:MFS transporter [Rhodoferax sp. GW822-FHT02A01]|uniref:MFS transporter n=1 Tax=Rhodoferax sp. GW822-FHT02A01 TaxID=3141537 RepID=UPI00315C5483
MKLQRPKSSRTGPVELTILLTSFIAATYGFGVYLFSTLLPEMRVALFLSYAEIGWITGVAQIGFLVGAFASARLVRAVGGVRLILVSVFACCACLGLMPWVANVFHIAILMVMAGCAAATVWVPMVAVVQAGITERHQGKVLGLISSGTAYGLFFNGLSTPILLPTGGWKSVWTFSAAVTSLLLVWGLLRLQVGQKVLGAGDASHARADGDFGWAAAVRDPLAITVVLLMFLNGIACMPTMNYLVAFLREEIGYTVQAAGWIWSTIGFVGMFGGFAMGALADRITVARSLNLTYVLLGISTMLFLDHAYIWEVLIGAGLFGLSFNAIFGLVPAFVSLSFDANKATAVFAASNVMLGLGSMLGNLLGGLLREQQQSFVPVYVGSLGIDFLLILLSLHLQRTHRRHTYGTSPTHSVVTE